LIVVGDTTLNEIIPLLERALGGWKGEGSAAEAAVPAPVARPGHSRVFLIDQPGAVQANDVIGGTFTSRLNMNLREDKHWSYGARSSASNTLGQRPWIAVAPVQIDKTAEALREMETDIRQFATGARPPTDEEVARIRNTRTLSLPGAYETASAVLNTISGMVRYNRPDDYVFQRKAEIEAMTPDMVLEAAKTIDPERLTWVVVGDLAQIERPIRALELGEVTLLDADGNPLPDGN